MGSGSLNGHAYRPAAAPDRRRAGRWRSGRWRWRSGRWRSGPWRSAGRWHTAAAAAVGVVGLALVTAGPAGVVLGWRALSSYQTTAAASRTHLGTPVRDGAVVFVVEDVACGADRLGPEADPHPATGKFCLVRITARNDGPEPARIHQVAQRAHGAAGARYLPDPAATAVANPDGDPFGELPPGGSLAGVLVFDVPPGAGITHVEMHAGVYTRGVAVSVRPG